MIAPKVNFRRMAVAALSVVLLSVPAAQAMAQENESVPAAQDQIDSRPATVGDLREMEKRITSKFTGVNSQVAGVNSQISGLQMQLFEIGEIMDELHAQMDAQRQEMSEIRADMREMREDARENFRWILAAIIALLGLPHLPTWINRLRGNEKAKTAG